MGFRPGELAGQGCGVLREITRVPKHSWMSLMGPCAVCWVAPILLEPLDGVSVRAPSLHYRYEPPENPAVSFPSYRLGAPLSVFRPKGVDYARAANSAPRGALQAVQSKCRGLSLIMPGARSRPEPVVLGVNTVVDFETSFE